MKNKKGIIALTSALLLATLGCSICAMNVSPSTETTVSNEIMTVVEDARPSAPTIQPRAGFDISYSSLSAGRYVVADDTFMIEEGDVLEYDVSWSPLGQSIRIGFVNVEETSEQYWGPLKTGGAADGSLNTIGVPTGEYYIAICADPDNTTKINVTGRFDWQ